MSGKLLLFGFDTLPELLPVHGAMAKLGVEVVAVPRKDYLVTMEKLLHGEHGAYAGGPLGGRMAVLCDIAQRDMALDALRAAGVGTDCLKAVLTAHNRKWSAVQLYGELQRERESFRRK